LITHNVDEEMEADFENNKNNVLGFKIPDADIVTAQHNKVCDCLNLNFH